MINRLRIINFRSHADTSIALQPVNLLVGPVAAGKSNLFKAMVLIQNSIHRPLGELFPPGLGEFHWVRSRWAGETDPIGFEVELEGPPLPAGERARYSLRIADSPHGLYVLEETLERPSPQGVWQWVFQRRSRPQEMGEYGAVDPYEPTVLHRVWHRDPRVNAGAQGPRFAKEVARSLSSFGYYHLEASALKSVGDGDPSDRIKYNGTRLPDFLAWLKFSDERVGIYEAILREMREILPRLESIIVTQVGTDAQGIGMAFADQRGYIAAPDLSDGTMFTLGLLCIVHGPSRPAILCLEEPETGLHPRRLRWLFDRFLQLAYPANGEMPTQVILASHSPYLVNFFNDMPECVHVVDQDQGRTRISSLIEIRERLHQEPDEDEPIGHLWATGLYEGL